MRKFTLQFGVPKYGWLTVVLTSAAGAIEVVASDISVDSLRELAGGALRIAQGTSDYSEINWFLEPGYLQWCLARDAEEVSLAVQVNLDEPFLIVAAGTPEDVLTPIWQGLRQLQADCKWDADDFESWSSTFPSEEVAQLGRHLAKTTS